MPANKYYALLDANGVYCGVAQKNDTIPQSHVLGIEVGKDCDLVPGKYYWSDDLERFEPLERVAGQDATPGPSALNAIARGFDKMIKDGYQFDAVTINWVKYYLSTFDAK